MLCYRKPAMGPAMSNNANDTSVFTVPDTASTSAGALFFAQHFDDLTWAANQSMLAKEIEELADMIVNAMENSRGSKVWEVYEGRDKLLNAGIAGDEAAAWA
jgi:hypothetical protein